MANLINYHGGKQLGTLAPMALFASITRADGTTLNWQPNVWYFRCQIDTFFRDFLASTYVNALRQFLQVPNEYISPGPYAGTTGLSVQAQADQTGTVSDGSIQASLQSAIKSGLLPYSTSPIFYCVLIPGGSIVIDRNGIRSDDPNRGFNGYHAVFQGAGVGPIYYCVIVEQDFDDLTYALSHEMVEQMTNSDGEGWYGDPDAIVNKALGAPLNARLEVCDYTFPNAVTIHGWNVAPFAYEIDRTTDPFGIKSAPDSDQEPKSQPDHGHILVDKALSQVSCMGGIVEGQEVLFQATASHYTQVQPISTFGWSATPEPPGTLVAETNGNSSSVYGLDIPNGCVSVTVNCEIVTAFLGCYLTVQQQFHVITQGQADQDAALCALIDRLKNERWYNPLWWIEKFDPEFNPKAREVQQEISRIAKEQRVSDAVLSRAKRIVLKDLAARIDAMITAFDTGRER